MRGGRETLERVKGVIFGSFAHIIDQPSSKGGERPAGFEGNEVLYALSLTLCAMFVARPERQGNAV